MISAVPIFLSMLITIWSKTRDRLHLFTNKNVQQISKQTPLCNPAIIRNNSRVALELTHFLTVSCWFFLFFSNYSITKQKRKLKMKYSLVLFSTESKSLIPQLQNKNKYTRKTSINTVRLPSPSPVKKCGRKPNHLATITSGQKTAVEMAAGWQCQPFRGSTETRPDRYEIDNMLWTLLLKNT